MMTRLFVTAAIVTAAATITLAGSAFAQSVAESKMPHSSVSVLVEPRLSDGRLIIKLAAKNSGAAAIPFGPSSVSIAKPDGQSVPIYPLTSLIDDVRVAAGLPPATASYSAPTQGAYAAPQQTVRDGGQLDVTGFTGGSTVGSDEYVRRSRTPKTKPTISATEADVQIAALKQAILQDTILAPGQVAAGQVVSDQLKFGKSEDRTLHVRISVAGELHSFTIAAPRE